MSDKAAFTPPNLALAMIALACATFMQVLDATIANVALPTIAGDLGVSADQGTWVITSFAVCNAIALPLTGWCARRFGQVRLFIASVLLFTLMSLLCGLARNMTALILFRALQGFFCGPMYPMCQTLMLLVVPDSRRSMALVVLSMVTVVAPILGPITGGWLTERYSWPWIFFINVPIGVLVSVIVWSQFKTYRETISRLPVDYIGIVLLVAGVGLLQIVLDKGNELDWFASRAIVSMSVLSAVALIAFVIWERGETHPIVKLHLFADRNFTVGTLALTLGFGAYFAINLILPQWLQTQMGYTSVWAGLAAAPVGILPLFLSALVGKWATRIDLRLLATLAFCVLGASCLLRSGFTTDVDYFGIARVQFLTGLGVSFFFLPLMTIILSNLHGADIADGSGLATFCRTLGAAFASSLATWIWSRRATYHHAMLTEHVSQWDPAAQAYLHATGGVSQTSLAQVEHTLVQQAYMMSTIDFFWLLGWGFFGLIVLIWFARPPFNKARPAPAEH